MTAKTAMKIARLSGKMKKQMPTIKLKIAETNPSPQIEPSCLREATIANISTMEYAMINAPMSHGMT